MAKILTGPLAAGLSGKLGPVVFHQTRFGQIVQSKAKGRVYTTEPAMASKFAFGVASRAAAGTGDYLGSLLDKHFATVGKTGRGQLIRQISAIQRGDTDCPGWPTKVPPGFGMKPVLGTPYTDAGRLKIPYTPGSVSNAWALLTMYDPVTGLVQTTGMIDLFASDELVTNTKPRTYPAIVVAFGYSAAPDPNTLQYLSAPTGLLIETEP